MYATNGNAERARWAVLWVSKGKVQRKDFDHDLAEALRVYGIAVRLEKPMATLACVNMAFPPPDKYADHEEDRFELITHRGKRYKKPLPPLLIEPRVYHDRMHAANLKGWWWCPYCIAFRKFRRTEGFRLEGIWVAEPRMICPVCKISHNDASVHKYNPIAARYDNMRRTRSDKGRSRA